MNSKNTPNASQLGNGQKSGLRLTTRAKPPTSEKRKQQNRDAQKTYREKRKRRIQELERLVSQSKVIASAPADLSKASESNARGFAADGQQPTSDDADFRQESQPAVSTGDINVAPSLSSADLAFLESLDFGINKTFETLESNPYAFTEPSDFTGSSISSGLGRPVSPAMVVPEGISNSLEITAPGVAQRIIPFNHMQFDPYVNHLQLHFFNLIMAQMMNGFHIGITESSCLDDDAISVFFRPTTPSDHNTTAFVKSVQRSFRGLKYDLRPTRAQILVPHHPYIDVLPFPTMRDRLIDAVAREPPLIDEDELCDDLEKEGIIFWGLTSPARRESPSGNGVPWDSRSYEARPWFLRKWKHIIGGEDGELWRSSNWWREMRGEEGDIEEVIPEPSTSLLA